MLVTTVEDGDDERRKRAERPHAGIEPDVTAAGADPVG